MAQDRRGGTDWGRATLTRASGSVSYILCVSTVALD